MSANDELREAQMEMRRCLVALQLELPEPVWVDVNKRVARLWNAAWDAVNAAQTSARPDRREGALPGALPGKQREREE